MGETEFLLDSMSLDDVMRAIGAIDAGSAGSANTAAEDPAGWREALLEEPHAADGLHAPASSTDLFDDDVMRLNSLKAVDHAVAKCTRCRLYKTATNPVPGEGSPKARLVCVGEAPGAAEDESGRPFVGPAGQLLTKILAAVNLRREDVYICNVLKHRPPGNRNPLPDEVAACSPYLIRQLELIKPKVIVAFGTFAAQTLLETKTPIGKLRGLVHEYHGIPLVVTYHPAALLRNPAWKRPTWEDVKLARRVLDRPGRT
jgi:uracil-DNA glycosylase family 4